MEERKGEIERKAEKGEGNPVGVEDEEGEKENQVVGKATEGGKERRKY